MFQEINNLLLTYHVSNIILFNYRTIVSLYWYTAVCIAGIFISFPLLAVKREFISNYNFCFRKQTIFHLQKIEISKLKWNCVLPNLSISTLKILSTSSATVSINTLKSIRVLPCSWSNENPSKWNRAERRNKG